MNDVLILIGPRRVDDSTVGRVRAALAASGIGTGAPDWLAPGEACEMALARADGAEDVARAALAGCMVDVACLPRAGRAKRILVADMDFPPGGPAIDGGQRTGTGEASWR